MAGAVYAVTLWAVGRFSWPVFAVALFSPALASVCVAVALLCCSLPQDAFKPVSAALIGGMHSAAIAAITSLNATANPQISLDPNYRFALAWLQPGVIGIGFLAETIVLVLFGLAGRKRAEG